MAGLLGAGSGNAGLTNCWRRGRRLPGGGALGGVVGQLLWAGPGLLCAGPGRRDPRAPEGVVGGFLGAGPWEAGPAGPGAGPGLLGAGRPGVWAGPRARRRLSVRA